MTFAELTKYKAETPDHPSGDEPYVELTSGEAAALAEELHFVLVKSGDACLFTRTLYELYRWLWFINNEAGWCDHSVGICACSSKRTLNLIAEKLGYKFSEFEDFPPKPEALKELVNA